MDYEKLYKKALERAKKVHDEHRAQPFDVMLKVFPELKKSGNERIRKELINYFIKGKEYLSLCSFSKEEILAWLENLDEQKPFNYEKANIQQKDFAPNDEEMKELLRTEYEKGKYDAIAEKQGEQKSQRIISAEAKEAMYGKPAWSEEDESRMNNLCHFLNEYGDQYYGGLTLQGTISWLKSIKERMKGE